MGARLLPESTQAGHSARSTRGPASGRRVERIVSDVGPIDGAPRATEEHCESAGIRCDVDPTGSVRALDRYPQYKQSANAENSWRPKLRMRIRASVPS